MRVLVDTSVWSLSLRRRARSAAHPCRAELHALIEEGRAAIIGPIRQELLSGIRTAAQFDLLRTHLRAFPDLVLDGEDYEEAARFFNLCRARGVQGSNTDFLICAAGGRREMPILTTDDDFTRYARLLPIVLHEPR